MRPRAATAQTVRTTEGTERRRGGGGGRGGREVGGCTRAFLGLSKQTHRGAASLPIGVVHGLTPNDDAMQPAPGPVRHPFPEGPASNASSVLAVHRDPLRRKFHQAM